jgi:hypothetical protein
MSSNQEKMKQNRMNNPDIIKAIAKKYYVTLKEQLTEYNKQYAKKKYQTDEEYRKYMNEKAKRRYYESKDPFIAESRRLMKMLI